MQIKMDNKANPHFSFLVPKVIKRKRLGPISQRSPTLRGSLSEHFKSKNESNQFHKTEYQSNERETCGERQ